MLRPSKQWHIVFHESSRGEKYVKTFLTTLDLAIRVEVGHMIDLLESHGPHLGMPYSRKLTDRLLELRIRGRVEIRIIYSYRNNIIYLLHAFQKKSQKTPLMDIKTALQRWRQIKA